MKLIYRSTYSLIIILFKFLIISPITRGFTNTVIKEYCQMETFKPKCGHGSVVVMEHARYGRMRLGRCVKINYGNIGCKIDIRSYLDTVCSGKQTCEIKIPDDRMFDSKPCPSDVTSYLEASYRCQKVHIGEKYKRMCRTERQIRLTDKEGYISSLSVKQDRLGSNICPWIIEAPEGQRINLTLYDFGSQIDYGASSITNVPFCQRYGIVSEESLSSPTTICSGNKREKHVYTSDSNKIKLQLLHDRDNQQGTNFIIKYSVVGCKDPPLDGAILVTRSATSATLKCNQTGEQWQLTCKNGAWSGSKNNCSILGTNWSIWKVLTEEWSTPYGILITIGLGVTLGVIIGVLLLICVLIFMKRKRVTKPPDEATAYGTAEIIEGEDIINRKWDQSEYRAGRTSIERSSGPYAHVWEPESIDQERTETVIISSPRDNNPVGRQYGVELSGDLLVNHKSSNQYGIYDRRMDHVYEKPT